MSQSGWGQTGGRAPEHPEVIGETRKDLVVTLTLSCDLDSGAGVIKVSVMRVYQVSLNVMDILTETTPYVLSSTGV